MLKKTVFLPSTWHTVTPRTAASKAARAVQITRGRYSGKPPPQDIRISIDGLQIDEGGAVCGSWSLAVGWKTVAASISTLVSLDPTVRVVRSLQVFPSLFH